MKLATIILPLIDNEGSDLFAVHQGLKHELLREYGGYTGVETIGGWAGKNGTVEGEKAIKYEVAMERADVCKFRELAAATCRFAKQEAVMIVTPNGEVEFVHAKPDLCLTENQRA